MFHCLNSASLNTTHLAKQWQTINCLWCPCSYRSQIEITITPIFSFPPLTLIISSFLHPLNLSIHLLFLLRSYYPVRWSEFLIEISCFPSMTIFLKDNQIVLKNENKHSGSIQYSGTVIFFCIQCILAWNWEASLKTIWRRRSLVTFHLSFNPWGLWFTLEKHLDWLTR